MSPRRSRSIEAQVAGVVVELGATRSSHRRHPGIARARPGALRAQPQCVPGVLLDVDRMIELNLRQIVVDDLLVVRSGHRLQGLPLVLRLQVRRIVE